MDDVAKAIQRGMVAKHWSRDTLADRAGIGLSSLDRIMSGARRPSVEHLIKISNALGFDISATMEQASAPQVAPDSLGAYSHSAVRWLENRYVAVRHAFQREGALVAHSTAIFWDIDRGCLSFACSDSFEGPINQRGQVSFSTQTGHSYLIANEMGRIDLTILGRPGEGGQLHGLCTTTYLRRNAPTPVSSAITLFPIAADSEMPACGLIEAEHPAFNRYARLVEQSERDGFAKLISQARL